jgi:hypothetical protein
VNAVISRLKIKMVFLFVMYFKFPANDSGTYIFQSKPARSISFYFNMKFALEKEPG